MISNMVSTKDIVRALRERLEHNTDGIYDGFVASISSAIKEKSMPFQTEDDLAIKILDYVIGKGNR